MKEKVEKLVTLILGSNESLTVSVEDESTNSLSRVITINTSEEQKPRIIGKGGSTIKAIHNLVNLIAKKNNERYFVKVQD